ncbi:MAG: hypothetical protein ACPGYT_03355 [Nitrospirales bacterium]
MNILLTTIIPAMMILLTTSGCGVLMEKPPPPLSTPALAFTDLCKQPTTIFCQDFDHLPAENSDATEGIFLNGESCAQAKNNPRRGCPEIEEGTLKFTVASNSDGGASGQYYIRFTDHNDGKSIGPGQEVFIQWKQRFSAVFLQTRFKGGGWKHGMLGAADEGSCSSNEIVVQNVQQRGFPQMYHACGKYQGFEQKIGPYDRDLQPGGPGGVCSYADARTGNISSGCTKYYPDEWLTYQIGVTHGKPGEHSRIRLWVSREGHHSKLAIDYQKRLRNNKGFGKMWLLPYHTNKKRSQAHPTGHIWYDQLIISHTQLPDR